MINNKLKKYIRNIFCVNCGTKGHIIKDCLNPITSFGIIAYKINYSKNDGLYDLNYYLKNLLYGPDNDLKNYDNYPVIKFLMIQRKDTMGYIDFIRGKYDFNTDDSDDILKKINVFLSEMTLEEKKNLLTYDFDYIWDNLWINHNSKCYKNEYENAKKKFNQLNIPELIKNSNTYYTFKEFSFPKGRRNIHESNLMCAEREFQEETGYTSNDYTLIKDYPKIIEEFEGTNGIKYKHIYFLVKMNNNIKPPSIDLNNRIQLEEVSNIGWFNIHECLYLIRPYDNIKKQVIQNVHNDICSYINSKKHNLSYTLIYNNIHNEYIYSNNFFIYASFDSSN